MDNDREKNLIERLRRCHKKELIEMVLALASASGNDKVSLIEQHLPAATRDKDIGAEIVDRREKSNSHRRSLSTPSADLLADSDAITHTASTTVAGSLLSGFLHVKIKGKWKKLFLVVDQENLRMFSHPEVGDDQ